MVNGAHEGYVRYRGGLRQGDPLSPLLFILVTDVLGSTFTHALQSGVVFGVPLGDRGRLCNLQYADDLLIITAGGVKDLRMFKLILFLFEGLSGLSINLAKTCLYFTRKDTRLDHAKASTLHCAIDVLPFTYIGILISGNKPRKQDFELLIEKVRGRLSTWNASHLSLVG